MTEEDARRLKVECDETLAYREAGRLCVAGWKKGRRIVHAHCGSSYPR